MSVTTLELNEIVANGNGTKPKAAKPVKPKPAALIRLDLPEEWGAEHIAAAVRADYGLDLDATTLVYRKADGRLVIEGQPVTK